MDQSVTYIKMCEQAIEIQDSIKYPNGNGDIYISYDDSFFAISKDNVRYYERSFRQCYIFNHHVKGYVSRPLNIFGCAVREDLPLVFKPSEVIWLPRQDQLQDIILKNVEYTDPIHLIWKLYDFCITDKSNYVNKFISLEQIWIALIMKEKYNKIWNDEDWILLTN